MTLEEIDKLGRQLFRDPDVYIPMKDALEDLGITWEQWLRRHVLWNMSIAMSQFLGYEWLLPGDREQNALITWYRTIGFKAGFAPSTSRTRTLDVYDRLCAAFRISSIKVQVGRPPYAYQWDTPPAQPRQMPHWQPPSPDMAFVLLDETLRVGEMSMPTMHGHFQIADRAAGHPVYRLWFPHKRKWVAYTMETGQEYQ